MERFVKIICFMGGLGTAAVAVLLLLLALKVMLFGIVTHWAYPTKLVSEVLMGLELLFLAPLGLLTFISLERYLDKFRRPHTDAAPEFENLQRTKVLIIGLMVAVVSTKLVDLVLSGELEIQHAQSRIFVILGLVVYLIVLEYFGRAHTGKNT